MDRLNLANYDLLVVGLHSFKFLDFFETFLSPESRGDSPRLCHHHLFKTHSGG